MASKSDIDLSRYKNSLSLGNRFLRIIWGLVWMVFARPLPRWFGLGWRRFLAKLFKAQVQKNCVIHSSARIYYPPNLIMGKNSCISSRVNLYNVDKVVVGDNVVISEGAFICTASHDITDVSHHLITKPITIGDCAWIGAEAFIGMGVTIGEGAVVGARAVVFKDVEPWTVVGGNPARVLKKRVLKDG